MRLLIEFYERVLSGGVTILLLGSGVFFWFYLRLTPFKMKQKGRAKGEVKSSLRALSVALAGTLGIGNITGVALALLSGGAGALFWMWVSAFVAMLLKYAEIVLACRYRTRAGQGGAMYYMRDGIGGGLGRAVGGIFACLCLALSLAMGGLLQSESIISCVTETVGGSPYAYGMILALLSALVIFGGVKSVSAATVRLVPLMSALYMGMCLGVILVNRSALPSIFARIIDEAMHPLAAGGGILGFFVSGAVRQGVSHGLLSNEAGCGTAPMAHITSGDVEPEQQGRMGMLEVFVDTILICSLTGISILAVFPELPTISGIGLTLHTMTSVYGQSAGYLLSVAVFFFAYATVICWGFYGESCVRYLTRSKKAITAFRVLYCLSVFSGCLLASSLVWELTDILLAFMTVINILTLLCLAREIKYGRSVRAQRKRKAPAAESAAGARVT